MASYIRLKAQVCCSIETPTLIVDDPTSAITTGNTYNFTQSGKRFCATVLEYNETITLPDTTFVGNYSSCEECLSGDSTAVRVIDCNSEEMYFVDISTFTTLPSFGEVYYMTITLPSDGTIITNCFTIDCFVSPDEGEKVLSLTSISDSYTGCTECLVNNIQTYAVIPCITTTLDTYYIDLPLGFDYTNYIINFTDETGESICGTVQGLFIGETNGTLISILGSVKDDGVTCDDCLTVSSEKRIITNCLNGTEQVVWGSTFYGGNEVTNLSTTDGCFEVGDLTESAVTINTFLEYNPQPSCQECIQCNGVVYSYSSCTNSGSLSILDVPIGVTSALSDGVYGPFTASTSSTDGFGASFYITVESGVITNIPNFDRGFRYEIGDVFTINQSDFLGTEDYVFTATSVTTTGEFLSYQYVQNSIGKTTYLPFLDDCVEITNLSTDSSYGYIVYSFDVFDNCTLCEENEFYVWKTRDCATNQNYVVTVSGNLFTNGNYVKVKWGTTDYQCHELLSPYDILTDGALTLFNSETVTPFGDCETCNSGTLIGASIVKCGGGGQQFVNIPINVWNTMAGVIDSQLVFVTEEYGQCYILLNNCPLEPNYDTITPVSTYFNCLTCYLENTRFPRSANTETLICLQICTESGTTVVSVAPPHPVWTDAYGTSVTQMNMVTIGGPDGLNS